MRLIIFFKKKYSIEKLFFIYILQKNSKKKNYRNFNLMKIIIS